MSRSHALRNASIVGILLLLSFAATVGRPGVSLLWRRVLHEPSPLMRPYRAPMLGCQWGDAIEGGFIVFLHPGCSLAKHKQVVGEQANLDSKITNIFPETARHGLYYVVKDIDDAVLDAIRVDIVVDMIECDRAPEIGSNDEEVVMTESPEL